MRDIQARLRLMHTIERPDQVFVRGQGSWLWDNGGRAYLDFHQGGAANSLGHSPSVLVEALQRQAENLLNPGPSFYNRSLLKLAARLCQATGSEQAYFLNSGAEANEAAVQLARKWGRLHRGGARKVISASQSGHGLTFGALSEQGEAHNGFGSVPFNDLAALQAAVDDDCVAVLLEPVQGDAGVIPATLEYLQGAERLCRERGLLLILDEVQTGIGRCGSLLAEELYGVRADIVTLGKGLGGGVPLAALLAR
ncbi:aminotransferase class III-fold pyridoxal phosphate-dependent enzyme, partial [Pseudomonas sp.]|uniref:aspartate aminotransferase family protein n=1 Tax=Pseudomonas sp. TaxID=306 RepID=UPI0028A69D10